MFAKSPGRQLSPKRSLPCFALAACALLSALSFLLMGCETTNQDRFQDYTEDGVFLFGRGEYQGARESFQEALRLKPENPGLLYNVGQCYERQGDYAKAENFYRQCLGKEPNHAESRYALTVALYRTGRRVEADQMIQEWLARQPGLADPYALDGWRLRQEKAYPQAQGRLHQALGLDPQNVHALTELAMLYELMQMPDRALVLYEKALQRDPRQPALVARINHLRAKGVNPPLPD